MKEMTYRVLLSRDRKYLAVIRLHFPHRLSYTLCSHITANMFIKQATVFFLVVTVIAIFFHMSEITTLATINVD